MMSRFRDTESLRIQWKDPAIKGCVDIFEAGEFDDECKETRREHRVQCPGGWEGLAKYRLTIVGELAVLDYSPYRAANLVRGMDPGVMTIVFDSADRVWVRAVFWQNHGEAAPTVAPVEWADYEPVGVAPYEPPQRRAGRRQRDVKDRPGQREFRKRLLRAYDGVCCITDCNVTEALDAAHIDQHVSELSDVPSNGLILRGDIHRLFDADLIGVDPATGKAVLSESLASPNAYAAFAKRTIREPRKGYAAYEPSRIALAIRWEQFQKAESVRRLSGITGSRPARRSRG